MSESRTRGAEGERSPRDEWLLDSLARQSTVMRALATTARGGSIDVGGCLQWWGLERQAKRYLRNLDARSRGPAAKRSSGELEAHRNLLTGYTDIARAALAEAEPTVAADAESRLGLRIAVVGKGGAGKSMISGTLARLLARRGHQVLAADLDTNPGMAFSLGVPHTSGGLPPEAVEAHAGAAYGWRLRSGLSPADVVERFTVEAPDGPRFLPLGKIDEPDKTAPKHTLVALLEVLLGFGDPGWDVVGDLEAGPTTPFERYHAFADRAIVVVGPAWRSAMTARRLLPLVADVPTLLVANRFRDEPDHPGLIPAVRVPFDVDAAEAERAGRAPLDCCPDSPAMAAIAALVDQLTSHTHQEALT